MRRARHKLQVSTFPFLAVLLGAMGALIFLLLVMDRRAKIVARNKVRAQQEAQLASLESMERQRQEEWERERLRLATALAAQDQDLRSQLGGVQSDIDQTARQLAADGAEERRLRDLLEGEQAKLTQTRHELRDRRAALLQSAKLEESARTELARLTSALLDLERTLEGLKRLESQRQPTYSLVPYRGQRGERRLPIYVECTRSGLVFLPDRLRLEGDDLDLPRVRAEVERRHGPLVKAQRADPLRAPDRSEEPYVLFLIRPDGIGSYYRGQNALRGYQLDFGYELVDAEWALEAPGADAAAHVAAPDRSAVSRSPGAIKDQGASAGVATMPGAAAPALNRSAVSRSPGTIKEDGPSAGASTLPAQSAGVARGPARGAIGNEKTPQPPEESPTFRPALDRGPAAASRAPSGAAPSGGIPQVRREAADEPGAFKPAPEQTAPARDDAGAQPQAAATEGVTSPKDRAPSTPPPAMARLAAPALAPDPQQPAEKKSSAPLGRVIGNRDFVVSLACYEDGVLLTPGSASFVWNGRVDAKQVDEALVRAVTQLVARRQATVRPGEPPYRPVLRFEVHEQGRRTYHRVYPLLENLRWHMMREDISE